MGKCPGPRARDEAARRSWAASRLAYAGPMPRFPLAVSTLLEAALQLAPLALLTAAYAHRARTLAAGGQAPPRWRQACFYGGAALIFATLTGLGEPSQEQLYTHMIEHLLLGDVAALLIVLGLTGPLLAPVLRVRAIDRLRVLVHPAVAFPLWALNLYVWHIPALY